MRGKGRIEKGSKGSEGSEDGFFVSLRYTQNDKLRRGQARPVRVRGMSGGAACAARGE